MNFREVPIRLFLRKSDSWIEPIPDETYKQITVRLWGKGLSLRGKIHGSQIEATRQIRVKAGQFLVSRIDARHGAFGIVPPTLDGALVSNDFPCFEINREIVLPNYLKWYARTYDFVDLCRRVSEGSTNRVRLKETKFLNVTIPLPPIDDQRRVAAKLESLIAKIDKAKLLQSEIQADAQIMLQSAFQQVIDGVEYYPMSEVAPIVRRKVEVEMNGEYPELGVRSFGKGTFHKPVLNGIDVGTKKLYCMNPGDLVFSNVFSWEGAIAVVQPEDEGRVGSHRFITCVPKPGIATADFLRFYLLTEEGIEKVREASPGGAGRNRTLGLKKLEKIEVPVPAYDKQLWFDSLQTKATAIKQAHAANQDELDALLPAILDKAFKGQL